MANAICQIPEIQALDAPPQRIRIPPEIDVPLTPRVRAIVDTPAFHRLAHVTQLGLVSQVYPAAHHRRFEHSLGVYRLSLLFLRQLAGDHRFRDLIQPADAEALIAAALLHDVGHWPFCHLIEDLGLEGIPRHEVFARQLLNSGQINQVLEEQWGFGGDLVANILDGPPVGPKDQVLRSILSGPIDVDKMDYLMRDSLHAGVPYGRNFDQARLIGSLCLNEAGNGLAVSGKGRTAAEMMVFARYVMFSEVYWHHAVRAATAMLQRAFFVLRSQLDLSRLFLMNELPFIEEMKRVAADGPAHELLAGLFGGSRQLYKRLLECSFYEQPELYSRLARQDYPHLVEFGRQIAVRLSSELAMEVAPEHVLIDAPPAKLEVQFAVDIHDAKRDEFRPLGDVSPVVRTLAEKQFDDYVKRVRVFVHPRVMDKIQRASPPLAWERIIGV
ncbi:MAG: HD domain-containing protein [Planctomycetaceae bacterium]|nr:HD domain-containing protein [Planctomycetaceae bacterium]